MIRGIIFAATVITVAINKTVMDGKVLRSMRAISARPGGRLGGGLRRCRNSKRTRPSARRRRRRKRRASRTTSALSALHGRQSAREWCLRSQMLGASSTHLCVGCSRCRQGKMLRTRTLAIQALQLPKHMPLLRRHNHPAGPEDCTSTHAHSEHIR